MDWEVLNWLVKHIVCMKGIHLTVQTLLNKIVPMILYINVGIASTNIAIISINATFARAAKAAKHWQNQPMCHF